jgi:hypothetical protein
MLFPAIIAYNNMVSVACTKTAKYLLHDFFFTSNYLGNGFEGGGGTLVRYIHCY